MDGKTATLLRRERMEMTLEQAIDLFLATKQTEGRSPKTIRWYHDMLTRFSEYLASPKLQDVSVDQARLFIASLQEKTSKWDDHPWSGSREGKLSALTLHGNVRTLKAFFNLADGGRVHQCRQLRQLEAPKASGTPD
jgi:site-specific recombinase XerD